MLAVGGWKSTAGSRRLAVGGWQSAAGSRRLAMAAGNGGCQWRSAVPMRLHDGLDDKEHGVSCNALAGEVCGARWLMQWQVPSCPL